MAIDASEVLGSAQLAGVKVNPRGYAWELSSSQVGPLTRVVYGRRPPGSAQTPSIGRLAFLAVTDAELALVKLRTRNGVTLRAAEVIARVSRREVQTVEFKRGYVSPLTIVFRNGATWRLEVPPVNGRHGAQVARVLKG